MTARAITSAKARAGSQPREEHARDGRRGLLGGPHDVPHLGAVRREARAIPEFFVGAPDGGFQTVNGTPAVVDTGRFLANDFNMAHVELAGRTFDKVQALAAEIVAAGGSAAAAKVDALDQDAIARHLDAVIAAHRRVDISFNLIGLDGPQGTSLTKMATRDVVGPFWP